MKRAEAVHLVKRFLGSLRPGGPPAADDAWARSHLVPGEVELWQRMSGADRRHAVGVARRTVAALGPHATRPVVAAALLHDVGKLAAGYGTFARVAATVARDVVGAERAAASTGRFGLYVRHPDVGRELLGAAGADPLTSAWAAEHHLPPTSWTVPRDVADALKAADDD